MAPNSGSSPLARGLHQSGRAGRGRLGIIPARAGFTHPSPVRGRLRGDHPRSRGVYRPGRGASTIIPGSSPLARGLRAGKSGGVRTHRIIPARAGFTTRLAAAWRASTDHPRSRGVYLWDVACDAEHRGSSPLARGLRPHSRRRSGRERIIPARAGFTHPPPPSSLLRRDHPRSRGVYACGSLVSQRTRSLPDPRRLHCRPRARSAGSP